MLVKLYEQSEGQFSASVSNIDIEALKNAALKMVKSSAVKTPKGKGNPYLCWQVQSMQKPHYTIILYKTRIDGHYTISSNFPLEIYVKTLK